MTLTFREGLEVFAVAEIELFQVAELCRACKTIARSAKSTMLLRAEARSLQPSAISASVTPNTHHHSPSGSDVSERQTLRSSVLSAVQPPMATKQA